MRAHLRTIAILACTAGLLALFLRNANLADVVREFRNAQPWLLVASIAVQGLTYFFRATRWCVLLEPIGKARLSVAFRTTVIGFAANGILPARAGEVLRPYLLARREGLPATSAFATIIIERFFDLAMVALLFGVFVIAADSATLDADPKLFAAVRAGGLVAALVAIGVLIVFALLAGHPERLGALTDRMTRALPARIGNALVHAVRTFAEGLAVMRQPALVVRAFALSVPLWLSIASGIWLVARAFHITIPFTGAFLIMALLTVGVAVPTPSAVGGFHYAFRIAATVFYGVPNERAVGAAIVLHAISFLPVTLVGLVMMARDGLTLGGLRHMAEAPDADEDAAPGPGGKTGRDDAPDAT